MKLENSVTILSIGARIQMSFKNQTGNRQNLSTKLQKNVLTTLHVKEIL